MDNAIHQAPIVQRVDSVINWISCYPVDELCTNLGKTGYSHINRVQNEGKGIWNISLSRNPPKASNGIRWLRWIVTYPVNKVYHSHSLLMLLIVSRR